MNYIFVAEKDEFDHVIKLPNATVIKTGAGTFNVIKSVASFLKSHAIDAKDKFFNVGYCGSNISNVGDVHRIGISASEFGSNYVHFDDIKLCEDLVVCYSSNDFVTNTNHKGVFDMELYTLANIFPNIIAYKIVSDGLNLEEFKGVCVDKAWTEVNTILQKQLS